MKVHPAAEVFPLLAGKEFDLLCGSIREHGQRHPIILWQGQIVDGRNRWNACKKLKVKPWTEEREFADNADAARYVLDSNIRRRHLTESQRGLLAAKLEKLFTLDAKKRMKAGTKVNPGSNLSQGRSIEKAATAANVSTGTAKAGKALLAHGCAELVSLVESGKVKVSAARKVAEVHTKPEQRKLCKKGPKAITERAADLRESEREDRDRRKREAKKPDPQGYECDACGGDVPESATACPHCGTVFEEEPEPEKKPPRKVVVGGTDCARNACKITVDEEQCIEADGMHFCSLLCVARYKLGHPDWKPIKMRLVNRKGNWEGFWESLNIPVSKIGTLVQKIGTLKE